MSGCAAYLMHCDFLSQKNDWPSCWRFFVLLIIPIRQRKQWIISWSMPWPIPCPLLIIHSSSYGATHFHHHVHQSCPGPAQCHFHLHHFFPQTPFLFYFNKYIKRSSIMHNIVIFFGWFYVPSSDLFTRTHDRN